MKLVYVDESGDTQNVNTVEFYDYVDFVKKTNLHEHPDYHYLKTRYM